VIASGLSRLAAAVSQLLRGQASRHLAFSGVHVWPREKVGTFGNRLRAVMAAKK
jgi:hypothetical protein